jgi:glyoxylase-like metal-dependent hydrolase (beta-lactamase superfamily II)
MHEADIPYAEAMQRQYDLFGIPATPQPFPIEEIHAAIVQHQPCMADLQILHTPGHTPGSICLYWPTEKTLLSGDTLFCRGYGRTDLPGGDPRQMLDSLRKLTRLPEDVLVYPGHGDTTTIGDEKW